MLQNGPGQYFCNTTTGTKLEYDELRNSSSEFFQTLVYSSIYPGGSGTITVTDYNAATKKNHCHILRNSSIAHNNRSLCWKNFESDQQGGVYWYNISVNLVKKSVDVSFISRVACQKQYSLIKTRRNHNRFQNMIDRLYYLVRSSICCPINLTRVYLTYGGCS